jgi:DNA invertase Pin-like site-specific DNA recombinase
MATFGYGRVSTQDQSTDNQRLEIERAGYKIDYWFADEGVSGAVLASQRPQFRDMLTKIRKGESLVVTKIDRLGRDAVDIQQTVKQLKELGVRVFVTQLGATDLTNSAGKMLLAMLAAFAEMERDLIIERTAAGLARARAQGVRLGRPSSQDERERPHSDPPETGGGRHRQRCRALLCPQQGVRDCDTESYVIVVAPRVGRAHGFTPAVIGNTAHN